MGRSLRCFQRSHRSRGLCYCSWQPQRPDCRKSRLRYPVSLPINTRLDGNQRFTCDPLKTSLAPSMTEVIRILARYFRTQISWDCSQPALRCPWRLLSTIWYRMFSLSLKIPRSWWAGRLKMISWNGSRLTLHYRAAAGKAVGSKTSPSMRLRMHFL